jgi:hypothetical protein
MAKIGQKIKEAVGTLGNLSKFKKFSKLEASYVEYDKFEDSNLHEVYSATTVYNGLLLSGGNVCL